MSLKIWLPLLGNLENKGTSPATITSYGATVNASGKIGSCYSFDGTDDYIQLRNFDPSGWAEMSIAFWCYPTDEFNGLFLIRGSGAHMVKIYSDGFSFRDTNNSTQRVVGFSSAPSVDTWTHVVCVYKRGEVYIYVNGVQDAHDATYYNANSTLLTDLSEVRIARMESSSDNVYYAGRINDFRIYDHALSASEAKELARGLVCYYRLDAQNLINKTTLTSKYYINASGALKSTTSDWYASDYIPIRYGYTYQTFDLAHGGSGAYVAFYNASKIFTRSVSLVANENLTLTPESGEEYIRLSIRNIDGELSIAQFVEDPQTVVDLSGYSHHGTIVGTASIEESTRHNNCTYMDNTSTSNHIECNDIISIPVDGISVSFWMYTTKTSYYVMYIDAYMSFAVNGAGTMFYVSRTSDYGFSTSSLTASQWNHVVLVRQNSTYKAYINGAEIPKTTTKNNWGHTSDYMYLLNRSGNTSYAANARISDFRMYCTALSQDDVLELYRVNASALQDNAFEAYDFDEYGDISISDTGVVKANEISENSTCVSLKKDKTILATQFIEI